MVKYIVGLVITIFFGVSHAFSLPKCTKTNSDISDTRHCTFEPEKYMVSVNEIGICKSAPRAPSAAASIEGSDCTTVFKNEAGSAITVSQTGVGIPMSGDSYRPKNGTYNYYYIILSPTVSISTQVTFDSNRTARKQMSTDGTGRTCWTVASNRWLFTEDLLAPGRPALNYVACGSSSTPQGPVSNNVNSLTSGSFTNSMSIGTNSDAYLLSTTGRLASVAPTGENWGSVNKIMFIKSISEFKVDNETQGIYLKLNTSEGAKVKGSGTASAHTSSDEIVMIVGMDLKIDIEIR